MADDAQKDLNYYIANPHEMPNDDATIARLLAEGGDAGETTDDRGAETPPTSPEGQAPAAQEGQAPASATGQEDPGTVLTRDGKHVIPYEVHANYRQRAAQADEAMRQAAEATRRASELEAQLTEAQKVLEQVQAQGGTATDEQQARLAELEREMEEQAPEFLVEIHKAQRAEIQGLKESIKQLTDQLQSRAAEVGISNEQAEILDTIDRIPVLRDWYAEQGQDWSAAVALDKTLPSINPKWESASLFDRLSEVARLVQAAKNEAPPTSGASQTQAGAPRQAGAGPQTAGQRGSSPVPRSISDIPGGTPPAQSERERYDSMDPMSILASFHGKTPEQIEQVMRRVLS